MYTTKAIQFTTTIIMVVTLGFFLAPALAQTPTTSTTSTGNPPYSKSITQNGFVFISGQVGVDPMKGTIVSESFEKEAHQAMRNVAAILSTEGIGFGDLTNVTVYLKTMDDYDSFNKVYRTYFKDRFPARVCIAVIDLPLHANVEVAAIAVARQKSLR